MNRTQNYGLNVEISTKLFGIVIISKTFLSTISSIIHFFLLSKNIVNIIFYRAENNIEKTKQLTIQAFMHYVAYYGAFTVFRKVMQHKEI